jgi:TonB family protein
MGKVTNSKRNFVTAFLVAVAIHAGAGIYLGKLFYGDGGSSIGFKNGGFNVSLELPQSVPLPYVEQADDAKSRILRDRPTAETRETAAASVSEHHADSAGGTDSDRSGVETLSVGDSDIDAQYPLGSNMRGEEGVVVVDAVIDASGHATDVTVSKSSGYPALDAAAVKAMKKAFFVVRKGAAAGNNRISQFFRFKLHK